jgi:5'-nucleotidase
MKVAIPAIPLLALVSVISVGCAPEKKAAGPNNPLDVSRPVTTADPVPAYQPAPAPQPAPQPVIPTARASKTAPAVVTKPQVAAAAPAAEPVAPASYTVQKGDTLFGIAKTQYGDGNQWKKIATANPGLSPNTLKVGQKIVIPQ